MPNFDYYEYTADNSDKYKVRTQVSAQIVDLMRGAPVAAQGNLPTVKANRNDRATGLRPRAFIFRTDARPRKFFRMIVFSKTFFDQTNALAVNYNGQNVRLFRKDPEEVR